MRYQSGPDSGGAALLMARVKLKAPNYRCNPGKRSKPGTSESREEEGKWGTYAPFLGDSGEEMRFSVGEIERGAWAHCCRHSEGRPKIRRSILKSRNGISARKSQIYFSCFFSSGSCRCARTRVEHDTSVNCIFLRAAAAWNQLAPRMQ